MGTEQFYPAMNHFLHSLLERTLTVSCEQTRLSYTALASSIISFVIKPQIFTSVMCREQNFTGYKLLICKATHCYCKIIVTQKQVTWKEIGGKDIRHRPPTIFLQYKLDISSKANCWLKRGSSLPPLSGSNTAVSPGRQGQEPVEQLEMPKFSRPLEALLH